MVHLISYDLDHHARPSHYAQVKNMIAVNAVSFKRPLYSQWMVETGDSVDTWAERLKSALHRDDHLLVIQVRPPYQGWLAKDVWAWLNARI